MALSSRFVTILDACSFRCSPIRAYHAPDSYYRGKEVWHRRSDFNEKEFTHV